MNYRGVTAEQLSTYASGPFIAACALLAIAGFGKLRHPASAAAAARALRLPSAPWAARTLGVVEISAAVFGIAFGGVAALAVAACYLALAIAAFALWRSAPATPCGCLGESTAPAGAAHVVVNAGAVAVSMLAALGASPLRVLGDQPLAALPFLALVACATWLAALTIDARPALQAAMRDRSS